MGLEANAEYQLITTAYSKYEDYILSLVKERYEGYNGYNLKRIEFLKTEIPRLEDRLKRWSGSSRELIRKHLLTENRCFKKYGCLPRYKQLAVSWFSVGHVGDKFIEETYGTYEKAFEQTQNCDELCDRFNEWFRERKSRFMENMDTNIAEMSKGALKVGCKPSAHGGVANLLKVLTRTMEKQGADIQSIAKVQYTVCVQAGIYIPDEFITDVAVALDLGADNE